MKDLSTQNLFEQYLYTDTSKYKFDFKVTTLYREDQPLQTQTQVETNLNGPY